MAALITTLGPRQADDLAMILPHEHIYVSLRILDGDVPEPVTADVIALMGPEIETGDYWTLLEQSQLAFAELAVSASSRSLA